MTDPTKPVEPVAWYSDDHQYLTFNRHDADMFAANGTPLSALVPAAALDAKDAEIERLTAELKFWTDCAAVRFRRAEKAEADRDALVAAAYTDARDQVKSYADGIVDGWAKECIRMAADGIEFPSDATAAQEARDAAKVREGWDKCISSLMQNGRRVGSDFHADDGTVIGRFHAFIPAGVTSEAIEAHYNAMAKIEVASRNAVPLVFGDSHRAAIKEKQP